MYQTTLKIDGMMCGMCESHINDTIRKAVPVKKVTSSHAKGEAVVLTDEPLDIEAVKAAVHATGYEVTDASNAIVIGFNVRPNELAQAAAKRDKVDMRMYRVIYDAINEITDAMKGMLAPKFREAIIGHAEVRQTYKVSAIGTIAGCYVKDGKITRDASVRVLRDNIVIHEGKLGSLQRFKDAVKEVAAGYECGMSIEKFNDIKEGDIFECFVMEQIKE